MAYDSLFEPIKIGPVEIKNRIALAPMNMLFGDDGYVNEQVLAYYAARVKGGIGLIVTEAVLAGRFVAKYSGHKNLTLFEGTHLKGHTELVDTIHAFGAKVFIQLYTGPGRTAKPPGGLAPIAPSPVACIQNPDTWPKAYKQVISRIPGYQRMLTGQMPHELTIDEIHQIEKEFAESAGMAVLCGYDGIEIHLAHGYLPHEFLSPLSNKRTDMYGGSLENRMRFSVELVTKTIERIRMIIPDFPIGVRMSLQEHQPGGFTYEEAQKLLKKLVEAGISFYDVSTASPENFIKMLPDEDGTMIDDSAGMKQALKIPVMTPAIYNPSTAAKAVNEGKIDMVSLGRAAIADPKWALKASEGRDDRITQCNHCCYCLIRLSKGLPIRCSVNPDLGRERYMDEYRRPCGEKGEKILPRMLRKNMWD